MRQDNAARIETRHRDRDVLVFLPGVAEIRRTEEQLSALALRHGLAVLPLHGALSATEQDAALRRGPGRRVVLATNVAETSVTVDGVSAVVDSGLARVLRYDPASGLDRIDALRSFAQCGHGETLVGPLHRGRARRALTEGDHQERRAHRVLGPEPPRPGSSTATSHEDGRMQWRRALLAAFPDRVARRRAKHDPRGLMVGGRGVRLLPMSSVREGELFVCVELAAGYTSGRGEAPEHLRLPSGKLVKLRYAEGEPPVLAVRIQQIFDWQQTPKIAGGRVEVLLHLLAPNMRPQQITRDLASFWRNTYPQIRKELAGRYPKHAWPRDPLAAD